MKCIVEYKNNNFRFDLIDSKMTYNYSFYEIEISFYNIGNIKNVFTNIFDDQINSPKQKSKIIIEYNNTYKILNNFIIKNFSINNNIIDICLEFDYLIIEDDYEVKLRNKKLKKIISKL